MGNDLIRGLVELITNADDAYVRAGRKGPIRIEAEHSRSGTYNQVSVRDQASGMSPEDADRGLLIAGARASGHELGHRTRGLQGRGAKDVAVFGKALFQTIKNGMLTTVEIDGDTYNFTIESHAATAADYAPLRLAPGSSGTTATIYVKRTAHRVPLQTTLADRLVRHYQLRDIMRDDKTEVLLSDPYKAGSEQRLVYQPPFFTELVLDEDVEIPGFKTICHLTVRRSEKQYEDERGSGRHGGILIAGRHAIYDCTYFGFEGRPGTLWFTGRLDCPYIDDLQDEYDDHNDPDLPPEKRRPRTVPEKLNPTQLITRRRDGLVRDHPFALALKAAIEERLKPLIEAEEAQAAKKPHGADQGTKKLLSTLASKLGDLYKELAREQELEVNETGQPDEHAAPVALRITPDAVTLAPDEEKTVSIFAWPEAHVDPVETAVVTLRIEPPAIATLSTDTITLKQDARQPRRLRGTVKLKALDIADATTLDARMGPYSDQAVIEVVEPEPPTPIDVPTRLVFERPAYSFSVGRRRRLMLWGPNDLIAAAGPIAQVRSTVSHLMHPQEVTLEKVQAEDGSTWYQAEIELTSDRAGLGKVRAQLGAQVAVTQITVNDPEGDNPFAFDLKPDAPAYDSQGRAEWMQKPGGGRVLLILCGHPSLQRYFGPNQENQGNVECRVLIAEVLAEELAVDLLKRKEKRDGSGLFPGIHTFDSERREYESKFLKLAHEWIAPESE
jgi:hypothetical protein